MIASVDVLRLFLVLDAVADVVRRDQDLDGRHAAEAVRAREKPHRADGLDDGRELQADLLLLVRREDRDDAVDRLGRVHRVEGRHDEVARLGGHERRLDGLEVAHLAHEDDVRVLPEGRADGRRERARVDLQLALVDDRLLVAVEELDRVLDRHDVLGPGRVDVVDHRGERRRLARAGRPGHEDEAARLLADLLEDGRQEEVADREDAGRDDAADHSDRPALLEDVAAEPPEPRHRVRDVDLEVVLELFLLPRGHDRERHRDRVFLHEALEVHERGQLAVDPDDRVRADLQVEVGRLPLDRDLEQVVDVHERPPALPGFEQG